MSSRLLRRLRHRVRRPQLALLVLVAALGIGYGVNAFHNHSTQPQAATATVSLSALPPQVETAIRSLVAGSAPGGVSFPNGGRRLPAEAANYYREYPVGAGQSQIVVGQGRQIYYSADDGDHFERVDLVR